MFSRLHGFCYTFCYPLTPQKPPRRYSCMSVATLCTKILSRSTVILATLVLSSVVSNAQVDSTPAATIPNSEEFLIDGPNGRKLRIQISHPHPDDPGLSLPIQDQKPVPIFVLKEESIAGERYKMMSNVLDLENLITNHQSNFGPVSVRVLDNESHHTVLGRTVTPIVTL